MCALVEREPPWCGRCCGATLRRAQLRAEVFGVQRRSGGLGCREGAPAVPWAREPSRRARPGALTAQFRQPYGGLCEGLMADDVMRERAFAEP